MTAKWLIIGVAGWLACGVAAYCFVRILCHFWGEALTVRDRKLFLPISMFGPMGLLALTAIAFYEVVFCRDEHDDTPSKW